MEALVKFDGKNWLGRMVPGGTPKIKKPFFSSESDIDFISRRTREGIGPGGWVSILNSRGASDPNGAEFRYEWLADSFGDRASSTTNGSAIYDPENNVYFLKGQEAYVRDPKSDEMVGSFLFYGLPLELMLIVNIL